MAGWSCPQAWTCVVTRCGSSWGCGLGRAAGERITGGTSLLCSALVPLGTTKQLAAGRGSDAADSSPVAPGTRPGLGLGTRHRLPPRLSPACPPLPASPTAPALPAGLCRGQAGLRARRQGLAALQGPPLPTSNPSWHPRARARWGGGAFYRHPPSHQLRDVGLSARGAMVAPAQPRAAVPGVWGCTTPPPQPQPCSRPWWGWGVLTPCHGASVSVGLGWLSGRWGRSSGTLTRRVTLRHGPSVTAVARMRWLGWRPSTDRPPPGRDMPGVSVPAWDFGG